MNRKYIPIGLLVCLIAPATAIAQNSFNGTWKIDPNSFHFSSKAFVLELQNGIFKCSNCVPPYEIKADGQDHPVSGSPYFDTGNVEVLSDHSIEDDHKKDGKIVETLQSTVSPDGKTLYLQFANTGNPSGELVTGQYTLTRVAPGPPGSHAVSGSWQVARMNTESENGLEWTFKAEGDSLAMTNPAGQSWTATLDGADAPVKGDPGVEAVSVKRISQDTIEETDKRGGNPLRVVRDALASDGKTMNVTEQDVLGGTTTRYTAIKQ